jgi:Fe-S-cluster containining protein
MFFQPDIELLASALRMKTRNFIDRYLHLDTDGIYALKSTPCAFLGPDNRCSVYEHRPKACREYPHTNHRKMHNKLDLALRNLPICPAVGMVLERLAIHYQVGA